MSAATSSSGRGGSSSSSSSSSGGGGGENDDVIASFRQLVQQDVAVPVAAMNALVALIKQSKSQTWMELERELSVAIGSLKSCPLEDLGGRTNISLCSGCDLFMKYVTRSFNLEYMEFSSCKDELLRRGQMFAGMSLSSRVHIAEIGHSFVQDGSTVLVHGSSRVVTALLLKAAETKQFNVMLTEGRPHGDSAELAAQLVAAGIPTSIVLDCAVGAVMDQVDLCLVGAEGVMENGGIVNKLGTYQLAVVAKALKRPFYVAVESYKFARMYPLAQRDVKDMCTSATYDCNQGGDGGPVMSVSQPPPPPPPRSPKRSPSGHASGRAAPPAVVSPSAGAAAVLAATAKGPLRVRSLSTSSTGGGGKHFEHLNLTIDFTPAEFITLLFTDLGVLTPAAVSDELIRLYQ